MQWIGRFIMPAGALYFGWLALLFATSVYPDAQTQSDRVHLGIPFFLTFGLIQLLLGLMFWKMKR